MESRERAIESLLCREVGKHGGLCLKFISGVRGVPDRVVLHKGRVFFIELKRPKGGVVSKHQEYWIGRIRECGVPAFVIKNKDEVMDFVERYLA